VVADTPAPPFTYVEVGATNGDLPAGYRRVEVSQRLGAGEAWFDTAAARLMSWEMHRRAGLRVEADSDAAPGCVALLRAPVGPFWIGAPVRVIDVVDEPTLAGFTYGTLPGHPESGEERFLVRLDPDGTVRGEIRAFSRPGRLLTRLGGPLARRMQDATTQRYLDALTDQAT